MRDQIARLGETFFACGVKGVINKIWDAYFELQIKKVRTRIGQFVWHGGLKWWFLTKNVVSYVWRKQRAPVRLLGIYDFKTLPWSIGDPLLFVEMLSVKKLENNLAEIDICIVFDRENPEGYRTSVNVLNSENVQDYILDFFPIFSACPFLGSIFQFSSREEFWRFFKQNRSRYQVYPELPKFLDETYNFSDSGAKEIIHIRKFFQENGCIPFLRIGSRESAWARGFYKERWENGKKVFVSVSLKRTDHSHDRNSSVEVWGRFFSMCQMLFPEVIFVIVGLREERVLDWKGLENVLFAKDYGTTIPEDFALVRTSFMYLGSTSGINCIAHFSDLPFLIFQMPAFAMELFGLQAGANFWGQRGCQKVFPSTFVLNEATLMTEFSAVYSALNKDEWKRGVANAIIGKHSHPTALVKK